MSKYERFQAYMRREYELGPWLPGDGWLAWCEIYQIDPLSPAKLGRRRRGRISKPRERHHECDQETLEGSPTGGPSFRIDRC